MRLLATKILDFHFKQRLLHHDFSLLEVPFIQIEPIPYAPKLPEKNIIVTSQNAAQLFLQHHPLDTFSHKPHFFCVGKKTAQFLTTKQANVIEIADNAKSLAERIQSQYSALKFSFACGKKRLPTLENKLCNNGIELTLHELYDTKPTSKKIAPAIDGILFYSPSAVGSYLLKNTIKKAHCFCIGPTTAAAVQPHTNRFSIAKKPDNNYLFLEIRNHYAA